MLVKVDEQAEEQTIKRELRIVSDREEGFSVVELKAAIPNAEMAWKSRREGSEVLVEVSFSVDRSEFNGADASGHIEVATDDPVIPTVVVPVVLTTGG